MNFRSMCRMMVKKSHFWGCVNNLPFLLGAHIFFYIILVGLLSESLENNQPTHTPDPWHEKIVTLFEFITQTIPHIYLGSQHDL